jgi:hypothetical protein
MALITPNDGKKFERDPEEGNFPTGVYTCELTRVEEIGPGAKFPEGNNRLVFEFTVREGQYAGKKACAFLGKTIHTSKDGRESNLVKWARMMGAAKPELGFDPDTLVGRRFQVMCEFTSGTGDKPGRAWARQAVAQGQTTSYTPPQGTTTTQVTTGSHSAAPALWDVKDADGNMLFAQTGATVSAMVAAGASPDLLQMKPNKAGREAVKSAREYGFAEYANPVKDDGEIPW